MLSLQNYTEKESASKFLKAFESYQNRTKNEIGALEHLCLKAYQEIVVPKSYLTCFRHFVGIYNGQDTANIVCEGKKISEKNEDGLFRSTLAFYRYYLNIFLKLFQSIGFITIIRESSFHPRKRFFTVLYPDFVKITDIPGYPKGPTRVFPSDTSNFPRLSV